MPVRSTMSSLITHARLLIADPAGGSQLFADQDVQDKLDECRTDLWQALLTPRITFSTAGMTYNDYYYIPGNAPNAKQRGFFEANEVLINGSFATLTPLTSDELIGHWTFNNQLPPVMIRGSRYDIYRASADLLDYKIAALSNTTYDFTSDGQTFHRSQILANLMHMRDDYRRKQEAVSHQTVRLDQTDPAEGSPGIQPRQQYLVGSVSQNVPFLTGE